MLRSRLGAEWVSAPTEMKSTPVAATSATFSSVTPARGLERRSRCRPALARHLTAARSSSALHVVEQQPVGAGVQRLAHLVEVAALDLDLEPGRPSLARARTASPTPPAIAAWLSLIRIAS